MTRTRKLLINVLVLFFGSKIAAMNLLRPYDTFLRPPFDNTRGYHANIFLETGVGTKSYNENNTVDNPFLMYNPDFNALAMLEGFDPASKIGQLRTQLNANDDGVRGHFCLNADLDLKVAGALSARFFFHDDWFVSAHLPFYRMKLKDVQFCDLTQDNNDADCRVRNLLTNNLKENVFDLGECLDICGWDRSGAGDLALLLHWFRDFKQHRPLLKNARVNWRLGFTLPTGKRTDEDKILAVPFGFDGSFALPFGLGLDLTLGEYFKVGGDVQLTHIFGSTRERRIKTHSDQSDLVLLQKAQTYVDFGLTQRFTLYFEFYKFLKAFSFKVGYQFLKHGEDTLSVCSNAFSDEIANNAQRWKDFTMHHMMVKASYDFADHMPDDYDRVRPYAAMYGRMPINGKRSVLHRTVGFVLGFDF